MKNLPKSLLLLIFPLIYLYTVPVTSFNLSHSLSIIGLLSFIGSISYLEVKIIKDSINPEKTTLQKLEDQHREEQLKAAIENIKFQQNEQKARRDQKNTNGLSKGFSF